MLSCPIKELSGYDCPGCGIQRSFLMLIKGEIVESFFMFPATIPLLIALLYLIPHLIFKFQNGARVIKVLMVMNVAIIMVNYIIKLATGNHIH